MHLIHVCVGCSTTAKEAEIITVTANPEYQVTTVEFGLDLELRLSALMQIVFAMESDSFTLLKSYMMQRIISVVLASLRRTTRQIQHLKKLFIC